MVRFTRKKIDSMTLGERMKKMREERRLSLNEISKETRIQVRHLEFLESGQYSKLPADVYVKGFLRNFGNYMRANPASLIKQYERERKIESNINKEEKQDIINNPINFSSFIVTPKMIITFGISVFLLVGVVYLYGQVNSFIANPRLVVLNPAGGAEIEGRNTRVSGIAEKDAKVFINDQAVLVNEEGEFSEDVGLQEGLNTVTVKAINKFDKESVQTFTVNAKYENQEAQESVEQSEVADQQSGESFDLEILVRPNSTWLSVEADGNLVYNGVLLPNATQKFSAAQNISIDSGKGSETYVIFKEGEEEILSEESGTVRDIVFTPNGRTQ